jgi:hypothetical protein
MAQTGFTPIQLYSSSTASATPTSGNLVAGELAINTADGKLFYLDNLNAVQVIGWKLVPVSAGGTGTTTSTGTGSVVLSDSPTFTTKITTPSVTAPTTDLTLSAISTGAVKFSTLGGLQAQVSNTASAVNYVQVTGGATGGSSSISAQGSDGAVALLLASKGGSAINFVTNGISSGIQFQVSQTGGAVNYNQATGGASNQATRLIAVGSDPNISMAFQSKGTGAIDLAAGSSGVNISNGGTVTAITRTVIGTGYTTSPTWSASAPTTAGGVTATGTTTLALQGAPTVTNGGTGYTVGDTLTLVGGTFGAAAQLTVSTVSAGVITGVTLLQGGNLYTAVPTNPIAVTGGTGASATFTTTVWGIQSAIAIGNAGSGYIEQPTVTFSGGGGSGAAAYASVGGTTIIKSLAPSLSFYTPAGESFRVTQSGVFGANYWQVNGAAPTPLLFASGSNGIIGTTGAGVLQFTPNNVEQFRVSNTASAVNYVQVTGSATGAAASSLGGLSFTGSDASPNFAIGTKGTGYIAFYGGATTNVQAFRINTTNAANTGNLLQVQGAAAGASPSIQAISGTSGTDANIDITLTPKGTGNVRFGTYTASILTPTGYIEVKTSDGTVRRLLVG